MTIQQKANMLFESQVTRWPLLGANWQLLDAAQLKTFDFDGFTIKLQFNSRRITSSAARVDKVSIEKRPCFLCRENRPGEEKMLVCGKDYEILCNPYPIFRKHFTIAKKVHTPQVIDAEFPRLLDLSRGLPELVVFYNAPSCGASAPDHMHFQAGSRGFMPIEVEIGHLVERYGKELTASGGCRVTSVRDGLRNFLVLESDRKECLVQVFSIISGFMRDLSGGEPMLNILAYYTKGWQIMVFPRAKHRPWQFFEEGERNILLSPAAVDMGGTMITPLEKDFSKMGREDIQDIFSQIILPEKEFSDLSGLLKEGI